MGRYKKIEKDTGWKPTVSFEQGVKKMLKEITIGKCTFMESTIN